MFTEISKNAKPVHTESVVLGGDFVIAGKLPAIGEKMSELTAYDDDSYGYAVKLDRGKGKWVILHFEIYGDEKTLTSVAGTEKELLWRIVIVDHATKHPDGRETHRLVLKLTEEHLLPMSHTLVVGVGEQVSRPFTALPGMKGWRIALRENEEARALERHNKNKRPGARAKIGDLIGTDNVVSIRKAVGS